MIASWYKHMFSLEKASCSITQLFSGSNSGLEKSCFTGTLFVQCENPVIHTLPSSHWQDVRVVNAIMLEMTVFNRTRARRKLVESCEDVEKTGCVKLEIPIREKVSELITVASMCSLLQFLSARFAA